MRRAEAKGIVVEEVARLRRLTYEELSRLREPIHRMVTGPSGQAYLLDTQSLWDDPHEKKRLRVIVAVVPSVGGWRRWLPRRPDATGGFLVNPDGQFVGEDD